MGLQQHIEEQIEKDLKLLKELEDKLRCEDDPRRKLKWRSDIRELRQKIREDEKDLEELKSEKARLNFSSNQSFQGNEGVTRKNSVSNSLSQEVQLKSAKGIDYTKLRDLLAGGKWREADQETARVMLKVAGREEQGWLNTDSIEKFPCEDLRKIDQLWVKYSKGCFGFSVQKKIYFELGGTKDYDNEILWSAFGDRVGWRVERRWLSYSELTFNLQVEMGNLPVKFLFSNNFIFHGWVVDKVGSFQQRCCVFLSRAQICNL